ncbi:SPOR domain-containing protein [Bdellovibrio sp. HCB2-146]|uniref:SPOR domain-containing protein n=1 Tax=Bdellovibrio sp. HCB2-146 TaxID=3394362 RepID=UPI0039BC3753
MASLNMRIEKMASKTDAVVKLVLVFFISLLSFSIGTFVGKKYSDNQHQLAALEPQKTEKAERSIASAHEEGGAAAKPGAMTDEEIAKLAEEFVADETAPTTVAEGHGEGHDAPAHGATAKVEPGTVAPAGHGGGHEEAAAQKPDAKSEAHSPRGATKGHVTATEEPSSAAKNIASGKAPTETQTAPAKAVKPEDRRPSALPKDVAAFSVGKFTVQVASYADEAEAQKFASELKDKGYSAFYIPANIKGKTWYRVSVGQFATQKEAQAYRSEFLSKSKVGSAIVQKITE